MSREILIAGSAGLKYPRLHSFLEESGFLVSSLQVSATELSEKPQAPGLLFWAVESDYADTEHPSNIWPQTPKILLLPEGSAGLVKEMEGFSGVLQEPWCWSEVLLILLETFPEDGGMFSEIQAGDWIDFSIASTRAVFQSMRKFLGALLRHSSLSSEQIYHIHYAICEILLNAMEHGNGFDPRKRVKGSFVIFHDQLVVKIEDQGCGFLLDQVPNPIETPAAVSEMRKRQGKRPGGYGLALASKWLELKYSDRGNAVLLSRSF